MFGHLFFLRTYLFVSLVHFFYWVLFVLMDLQELFV